MLIKYPDLGLAEREEQLKNECNTREMRSYSHSLQQSEVDLETKEYANDGMELDTVKEQLTNIKNEYAAKIKNIEERMKERLEKIKYGKKTLSGYLYGIADHTSGRMLFYDKFGELVESRDLLPQERQGGLFINRKEEKKDDLPFVSNTDDGPKDPKEEKAIADAVKPLFTPVMKNDPKRKGKQDQGDQDDAGSDAQKNDGLSEQEQMDIDNPVTMDQLKASAKVRTLTPDEQERLQKFNSDEKNEKRRASDVAKRAKNKHSFH